jgi:hypothetical protein
VDVISERFELLSTLPLLCELPFDCFMDINAHTAYYVPRFIQSNFLFDRHRLGEWVMLMLGESVLSLLIVEASEGRRYFVSFYSGMASVM